MNPTNGNTNDNAVTSADIPMMLKARYFGSGLVVGVMIAPLVKGLVAKLQPKLDSLVEGVTGQAEGIVEKGNDFMAKAKSILKREELDEVLDHKHSGSCTH